ncbi:MAG TPA: cyclic nucleotide-binding domain-containing protein [Terriglobales bacterium]|nr:cyclic nucleotide-binding domain-containing protein [Terriglobales bacterium]
MPNTLDFLTANDRTLLTSKAKKLTFGSGQTIIREGDPSWAVYMIRSGQARVERNGRALATLTDGDVFGEMAFLEAGVASASVVAQDVLEVELLESAELHKIFESFPHLGSRFYRSVAVTLSRRLRETSRMLAEAKAAT